LTTPSAQLQSAFFSSPTAAPASSPLALHTPHVNHSPLTSLLQPHSSTLQVRRNSTGGSGITKLLSSFKRTTKASTTLTSAPSSSLFKKKLTAASTLTASSSAASSDSAGGSSCHQCKSRRNYGDLSYCSSSLNKKNKNAVCRKKYCDHCLPEHDTRVLTDRGFLFLADIERRIGDGESVLYACYDTKTASIVYRAGQPVIVPPPTSWVDFTEAGTRALWDATSDDYGSTVPANSECASRLTLRTTPEHDMYVQLCTTHEERHMAPIAPRKMAALELAPGFDCDCDTAGRPCAHGYSQYRMYTGAQYGLQTPADVISLADRSESSPVVQLGLHSADELDAFLELFGCWLQHGSMQHSAGQEAVVFAPKKAVDRVYLRQLLARLHLSQGQHFTSDESDLRLSVRIIAGRWFSFFDQEFGVSYKNSRHYDRRLANLKQGMPSTQRRPRRSSTASTVSSSTTQVDTDGSGLRRCSFSDTLSAREDEPVAFEGEELVKEAEGEDEEEMSAKWLPDWALFRLDARQLRRVIDGLRLADGKSAAAAGSDTMQAGHEICTSGLAFRDQLIQACLHAGYSAYFKLNTRAREVRGYHALPDHSTVYTEEEREAALQADPTRHFQPVRSDYDSWRVCYTAEVSQLLPAQDVHFDSSVPQQQTAASIAQRVHLYDKERDGRVWCVAVQHDDHLIFVQRAHRDTSGVVTKVGRTLITGNCLKKFYREAPIAANGQVWKCPSCRKICCCAACRRREMRGGGAGTPNGVNGSGVAGDANGGEMDGQNVGMDTPPSNALSPVHSSIKHEHPQQQQPQFEQQQQQDVEMSPVDQSPSPPQSAFRGLLLSPHTPSLPPLPASALAARERDRESREGKDESLPIRDIHRTLLTVANSPALTALSAAASTLNGGSYSIKKEKASGLLDGGSMGGGAGAGRYAGLMTASLSRGLGVSALNGHSLLNGHSGHRHGRRRNGAFPDMNGHESSTSSPSSTDDSDDDTADGEGESSTVGDKDEPRNGHTSGGGADSALGTFALFYSIGQMGVVQEGVRDVMKRSEASNAQKLKEIEGIFFQVAERVSAEEVPLQL